MSGDPLLMWMRREWRRTWAMAVVAGVAGSVAFALLLWGLAVIW